MNDKIAINPKNEEMMRHFKKESRAITFDDVTFEDKPSNIHPTDALINSQLTKNISLKTGGIMSAAMDTVTEAELALALAKMGGMGILHRNLSAEEQTSMVKWVRTRIYHGGRIDNPVTFNQNIKFSTMQRIIAEEGYTFTSFPIIDDDGILQGLITRDEMSFAEDKNPYLYELTRPMGDLIIARDNEWGEGPMTSERARNIMRIEKVKKLPVIDDNGKLVGMYVWNDLKDDERKRDMFSLDEDGHFLVGAAIGVGEEDMDRVKLLVENGGCKVIVIDTSHGASQLAKNQICRIREAYGNKVDIIVGNVASYESAMYLLKGHHLPDAIKVGISSGSICTTREVTGHGMPQVTAIFEVYSAVKFYYESNPGSKWISIIADGGLRSSGDILKCYAMGASGVMLGSVFAGSEESPGQLIQKNGKKYKKIRGMGSKRAMEERQGSRKRYSANENEEELTVVQKTKVVPEGVEGVVEIRGSVENVMTKLSGGIRAGLAHSGADSIDEFRKKNKLWFQTFVGTLEGRPHDIFDVHE
jgi:IMP dehydrogenase